MQIILVLGSLLIVLELFSCFRLSSRVVAQLNPSSRRREIVTVICLSIWLIKFIVYQYVLLLELPRESIQFICIALLITPVIVEIFLTLIGYRKSFRSVVTFNSLATAVSWPLLFLPTAAFFVLNSGEDSWDGSAYHFPIEFFAFELGSLWGWPDLIYAQWQSNSLELIGAFNDTLFSNLRFGILTNYIFMFFILSIFWFPDKNKRLFALLAIFGTPSLVQQLSTRYIDLGIASLGIALYIGLKLFLLRSLPSKYIFVLLPISTVLTSSKLSALLFTALMLLISFILERRTSSFFLFSQTLFLVSFGYLLGNIPVLIRNLITFSNPFYPYNILLWENGLFEPRKVSNALSNFYLLQTNLQDSDIFSQFLFQYLYSPFHSLFIVATKIFNYSSLIEDPYFYRVFIYDNRLGGFGVWFPIMLIATLLLKKFRKVGSWLVLPMIIFIALPTSFHSRYYLGFALIFLFEVLSRIEFTTLIRKRFIGFLLCLTVSFACVNVISYLKRNLVFSESATMRSSDNLAKRVNPYCLPLIHVGSGPWMTDALFGPNQCQLPIFALSVGGSLIDVNIGRISLTESDKINIRNIAYEKNPVMLVCSSLPNRADPCIELTKFLDSEFKVKLYEIFRESGTGPRISVYEIAGQNA